MSKPKSNKKLLKSQKAIRDKGPELKRKGTAQQDYHKRILIVGEGVNTEPSYFEKFMIPGVKVVAIGLGEGTRKLVHDVEKVRIAQEEKLGVSFDEIWVAFDKDSFKDFEQAVAEAKSKGYGVAYSNQAIEYWFILHFKDHQGSAMPRTEYAKNLNELLEPFGLNYNPDSKEVSDELFNLMYKHLQKAFDRACHIYNDKLQRGCSTEESITTIHRLIHAITGMITTEERRVFKQKEESKIKAGLQTSLESANHETN